MDPDSSEGVRHLRGGAGYLGRSYVVAMDVVGSRLKVRFYRGAASCDRHGERGPVEALAFEGEAAEPEVPEERSKRLNIVSVVFERPILRFLSFLFDDVPVQLRWSGMLQIHNNSIVLAG